VLFFCNVLLHPPSGKSIYSPQHPVHEHPFPLMLEIKFHTRAARQIKLSGSHTGAGDDSCLLEYLWWFAVLSYVDHKTVITTECQMPWSVAA